MLQVPRIGDRVDAVRICRSWPDARITARRVVGAPEEARYAHAADRALENEPYVRIDVTFTGDAIRALRDRIHGTTGAIAV